MSHQDIPDPSGPGTTDDDSGASRARAILSRRNVLGGTAVVAGGLLIGSTLPASATEKATVAPATYPAGKDGDIVAYVRDARNGVIEIFVGERQVTIRDQRLAAALTHAAR